MEEDGAADAGFRGHCAGFRESDLQYTSCLTVTVPLRLTMTMVVIVTVAVSFVAASACAVCPMRVCSMYVLSVVSVRENSVIAAYGFAEEIQDVTFEGVVRAA